MVVDYEVMIEGYIAAEDYTSAFYYARLADGRGNPEGTRLLDL